MAKKTAIQERVDLTMSAPSGRFSPGGASVFREHFLDAKSVSAYLKWRENPLTVLYLSALRSFAATPPAAYLNGESAEIQYGVQSGLTLALSLADDPTSVFPDVFGGGATSGSNAQGEEPTSYTTPPDILPDGQK